MWLVAFTFVRHELTALLALVRLSPSGTDSYGSQDDHDRYKNLRRIIALTKAGKVSPWTNEAEKSQVDATNRKCHGLDDLCKTSNQYNILSILLDNITQEKPYLKRKNFAPEKMPFFKKETNKYNLPTSISRCEPLEVRPAKPSALCSGILRWPPMLPHVPRRKTAPEIMSTTKLSKIWCQVCSS